jgi:hypothetical protein
LIYNGVTVVHYLLGGVGITLGYGPSWLGCLVAGMYLAFAFGQMYVIMPLSVCPNCLYYRMENSLCISGKNVLSRMIAKAGNPLDFPKRAQGLLCHNNLYLASLVGPIVLILPALVLSFSVWLLAVWLAIVGLLLFRFVVIFGQIACLHCIAKYECPNAERTGVRDR